MHGFEFVVRFFTYKSISNKILNITKKDNDIEKIFVNLLHKNKKRKYKGLPTMKYACTILAMEISVTNLQ